MSEAATPEPGALTVEQAIATLAPEPVEQQDTPQAAEEAPEAIEPQGEANTPEEAEDGAETPAEVTEAEVEAEPVVAAEPPRYWSQDAKAKFAELPPELQAVVLAQEGPREEATAKAKAEAAERVKSADAELGKVQQLASGLADRLPQWIEAFESRWGKETPDWPAIAAEHGTEAMSLAKVQFEREAQQLQEAAKARSDAEALALNAYFKAEHAKLAEVAPELADPETGPAKRTAITQYLVKQGLPPEAIERISATEMSLAHKAMLYDQAQSVAKAAPKPKPAAPAPTAPVRPSAGQAQAPSSSNASRAQAAFNLRPTRENAEALLLARKG